MIAWVGTWAIIITIRYKQEILLSWQEPVLKYPVLIFEGDDWGAGPLIQDQALEKIISLLTRYVDKYGHHPMMTLGVILSIPDAAQIIMGEYKHYYDLKLDDEKFLKIKNTMLKGVEKGIFDLQLHGMAHYWPDNLMYALQTDDRVKNWLNESEFLATEMLPSVLQSRWTNTRTLPTKALEYNEIKLAVKEEVEVFTKIFGVVPKIVVPPTFVWTTEVENRWNEQAIEYLVTPGQRFEGRSSVGEPIVAGQKIYNNQKSCSGLTYIVRNDFFEPGLGHTAEMALKALDKKTKLSQPTLLEIHRANFIQNDKITITSLEELEKTIVYARKKYPDLMFLSTKELADKYVESDLNFIKFSYFTRVGAAMERMWAYQPFRKWLYISGLILPFFVLRKSFKDNDIKKYISDY